MSTGRAAGQSLVELALVAPMVILLAMAAWDGGSILREQVILQQAARDGARVAATGYGQSVPNTTVSGAVLASAQDLPGLVGVPGYLSVTYPDAQTVQVQVRYVHVLVTPVLRLLWGGGQSGVALQASAAFYLPQLTPVPATVVPSTPIPTATPTPSATPTASSTPTPTRSPTPTPTPSPTPSPSPTATATPPPTPTPEPDDESGDGNRRPVQAGVVPPTVAKITFMFSPARPLGDRDKTRI